MSAAGTAEFERGKQGQLRRAAGSVKRMMLNRLFVDQLPVDELRSLRLDRIAVPIFGDLLPTPRCLGLHKGIEEALNAVTGVVRPMIFEFVDDLALSVEDQHRFWE